jgi:Peptidase family M23
MIVCLKRTYFFTKRLLWRFHRYRMHVVPQATLGGMAWTMTTNVTPIIPIRLRSLGAQGLLVVVLSSLGVFLLNLPEPQQALLVKRTVWLIPAKKIISHVSDVPIAKGYTVERIIRRLSLDHVTHQAILKAVHAFRHRRSDHALVVHATLTDVTIPLTLTDTLLLRYTGGVWHATWHHETLQHRVETRTQWLAMVTRTSLTSLPVAIRKTFWRYHRHQSIVRLTWVMTTDYVKNKPVSVPDITGFSVLYLQKKTYYVKQNGHFINPERQETSFIIGRAIHWPMSHVRISSPFGWHRMHPVLRVRRPHFGIDLSAPIGTDVHAASGGRVSFAGRSSGYGNLITLDHGRGITTRYGHLSRMMVHSGQIIADNAVIGKVGKTGLATGPHLHFEYRVFGIARNPMLYLGHVTSHHPTGALQQRLQQLKKLL